MMAGQTTIQVLLLSLMIGTVVKCSPRFNADQKPNIIFLLADDMGFNDVSFHGCPQIPTPNLDKLAAEGIILNNFYTAPICTPSRATLMTGRYPIHTGMQSGTIDPASPWGLSLKEKLLPQYLKELGYKTHAIGKWHLGFYVDEYKPAQRGFDTFYGYYSGAEDYWDHSNWLNGFWGLDLHSDNPNSSKNVWTQWGNYSSYMFAMEAIDRIRDHNQSEPLFLYLAYQAVHDANLPDDALQAPMKWLNKFSNIKHLGRRKYAAVMGAMDESIGQLYKELEAKGMLDNTIIVFMSDNGGPPNGLDQNWATNYPFRGAKTTVWEGGTRSASFIHSKLLKNQRVSHDLMHVSDWLPTLLAAAGYDVTKETDNNNKLDGMNLWETLKNPDVTSPRTEVLLNIDDQMYKNAALRVGDWKIIKQDNFYDGWYPPPGVEKDDQNVTDPTLFKEAQIKCGPVPEHVRHCGGKGFEPCLFNITADPCEYYDLSEKFPDVYQMMLDKLEEYHKGMVTPRRVTWADPYSNPKLHGGVWDSWRTLGEEMAQKNPDEL